MPDRTSLQSFGDLSRLLRQGVADEETREFRESLGELSAQIDELVTLRRRAGAPEPLQAGARRLLVALRSHQQTVTGLGSAWAALYEFGAYERSLQATHEALGQWLQTLERRSPREAQAFPQFERVAWRTLGEALLLLDMYAQQAQPQSDLAPGPAPGQPGGWWQQLLRRWRPRR